MALADDLARLIDDMITRQVDWEKLDRLVPDELDEYWQQSLDFLKFVHPRWPRHPQRSTAPSRRPSGAIS